MGATVHSHSITSRGSAAVLHGCASSRARINPACVANPAAAASVAENSKRPGSFHGGDPTAKRARGSCGTVQPDAVRKIKTRPRPNSDEDGVEASCVTKNMLSSSFVRLPEVAAPPEPPACTMRELLERAHLAKARAEAPAADAEPEAVRRREIERRRAEARREREQMVPTVEFNDPFIDYQAVVKWRLEFISQQRKEQSIC